MFQYFWSLEKWMGSTKDVPSCLNVDIRKWKIQSWSIVWYSSLDLKNKYLQCITKTKKACPILSEGTVGCMQWFFFFWFCLVFFPSPNCCRLLGEANNSPEYIKALKKMGSTCRKLFTVGLIIENGKKKWCAKRDGSQKSTPKSNEWIESIKNH